MPKGMTFKRFAVTEMYGAGEPVARIAETFRMPEKRVRTWARERGVRRPAR